MENSGSEKKISSLYCLREKLEEERKSAQFWGLLSFVSVLLLVYFHCLAWVLSVLSAPTTPELPDF